jgi:hypothetical protein
MLISPAPPAPALRAAPPAPPGWVRWSGVKVIGSGSSRSIWAGVPEMRPVVFPPVSVGREPEGPEADAEAGGQGTGPGLVVVRVALMG